MSGSTHGDRKLSRPAVNEISTPNETDSIPALPSSAETTATAPPREGRDGAADTGGTRRRLLRLYYRLKYRVFQRERRPQDGRRGLIVLQIDALAYAELRRAIELGY